MPRLLPLRLGWWRGRGGGPGAGPAPDAVAALVAALGRPAVLAHRGACRRAPENSLAALRLAAGEGADGVEFDVQPCGSGELVVFHDATLGRCTGAAGFVRDTPLAQLRRLVLDRADPAGRHPGERIPTLAEWLAAAPAGLFLNLEAKADTLAEAATGAACAKALAEAGRGRTAVLSSFHPAALRAAAHAVPGIDRALLLEELSRAVELAAGPVAALHPPWRLADARRVAAWHRRGRRVGVWTADRPDDLRRCLDAGADVLITNRPDVARPLAELYRR